MPAACRSTPPHEAFDRGSTGLPDKKRNAASAAAPPRRRAAKTVGRLAALAVLAGAAVSVSACRPADKTATAKPSPVDSASACRDFVAAVCKEAGEPSRACQSTRSTSKVLHPSACAQALRHVDYTKGKLAANKNLCSNLVDRLCADLGAESRACQLVRSDLAQLQAGECEALDNAYAEVLAELRELDESLGPLSEADQRALLAGDPPSFGVVDAPIAIVLFSDFECPFCATAAKQVEAIKTQYGAEVRFVFRQFPLSFHPHARAAAEAALAAHAQGKFWAFHDQLFANQNALDRPGLEAHAAQAQLDVTVFRQALDAGTHGAAVDADFALGRRVEVEGTPTMFINGIRVADPTDMGSIAETIDEARQSR